MKTTIEFLPTRKTVKAINCIDRGEFFLGTGRGIDTDHHLCLMIKFGSRYFNFSTNEECDVMSNGLVTPVNVKILVDQN